MEAIKKVTQTEEVNRERVAAAAVEARQLVADAERAGLAALSDAASEAKAAGRELLQRAEAEAEARAAEIRSAAEAESAALRTEAEKHLEEASEFIVERVVKY